MAQAAGGPLTDGWPCVSDLFFLSRFETAGAPSLRFCKGGYDADDAKVLSMGRDFVSESSGVASGAKSEAAGSPAPALRKMREEPALSAVEGTGHPLCGCVRQFQNPGHPSLIWSRWMIDPKRPSDVARCAAFRHVLSEGGPAYQGI